MRARAATSLVAGALALGLVLPAAAAGAAGSSPSGTTDPSGDAGGPAVLGPAVVGEWPGPASRETVEPARTPAEAADEALAEAKALFTGTTDPARRTTPEDGHGHETGDATMVLRELRTRYADLSAAEQQQARAMLLRPTTEGAANPGYWWDVRYDGTSRNTCEPEVATGAHVCVHWADTGEHAPDTEADADQDGTPDQIELTATTFEQVWAKVVARMGYRAPLDDSATPDPGPNGLLDVYVVNMPENTYGFCVSEGPVSQRRAPGYCAVDNDYAGFPGDPDDLLRVTAAHEFFHAVQFAYDWLEDPWMMESTAAWIEDEVYDSVNDNRQYLQTSPLTYPLAPLDYSDGTFIYGSWIFWRFLSEHLPAGPVVVRDAWERAAGAPYSVRAIRRMLEERGRSFPRVFGEFGATSRYARAFYDEGGSYVNAPAETFRLTSTRRQVGPLLARLNHLSHVHARLIAGDTLRGTWRLRIGLDLPARVRGSVASVTVTTTAGERKRYAVRLDRYGNDQLTVPFSRSSVAAVTLTLTNASTRMADCAYPALGATPWWCGGEPLDDGTRYVFTARAIR